MEQHPDAELRTIESIARELPENPRATYLPRQTMIADGLASAMPIPSLTAAPDARSDAGQHVAGTANDAPQWSSAGMTLPSPARRERVAPPASASLPYRIRRLRGRGGFGEVWEAVQSSLGRVVAIKMLRRDMIGAATGAELADHFTAFQAEAASAARLEHPNIVPVYDLGADATGAPMLAMKLVEGRPWDELLLEDLSTLEPEELLARHLPRLVDMAQAVAFAHARGIVHRDLKPAQVMIGEFGEVLLMDWGLAVAVGGAGDLVAALAAADAPILRAIPTPATASNPAGTPAMMAPEQVRPDAARIGPWTDIFLLGGTLYVLLTGTYPYHVGSSLDRMKRALVGLIEPPEERAPGRFIPADLSALCMKALEVSTDKRLGSVRDFIAGLDDHLTGASRRRESEALVVSLRERLASGGGAQGDYERWSACGADLARARDLWPDNAELGALRTRIHEGYARAALAGGDLQLASLQARQLEAGPERDGLLGEIETAAAAIARAVRQRRLAIVGSMALMALVVVGSIAFSFQLNSALRRAELAEDDAEARHRDAVVARDEAARRRGEAEELFAFAITDLRKRLAEAGRIELLDEVAHRSQAYFNQRAREPVSDVDAVKLVEHLLDLGGVFGILGDQPRRLETYVASLEVTGPRRSDPTWNMVHGIVLSNQGEVMQLLGNGAAADALIRESIEIMATIHPAVADNLRSFSYHLSRAYFDNAQYLLGQDEPAASLAVAERGVETQRDLLTRYPDDFQVRSDLGYLLFCVAGAMADAGRDDEALAALDEYEATERYMQEHGARAEASYSDYGNAAELRGEIALKKGDLDGAEVALREAIDWMQKAVAAKPIEPLARLALVGARSTLINVLRQAGRPEGTTEMSEANIGEMEALVARDPTNVDWSIGLAGRIFQRGYGYFEVGRDAEGDASFTQACDRLRGVDERHPGNRQTAETLPIWLVRSSASKLILGKVKDARLLIEEAVRRVEFFVSLKPDDPKSLILRADVHARCVWTLIEVGDVEAAAHSADAMRSCVDAVGRLGDELRDARRRRADIAASEAMLAAAQGRDDAMRAAVDEVLALYPAEAAADPRRASLLDLRAPIVALVMAGRIDEARPVIERMRSGKIRDLLLEVFLVRHGLGRLLPDDAPAALPSGQ